MLRTLTLLLCLVPTAAMADWQVQTYTDKMTDRVETSATLTSGPASLVVSCVNNHIFPRVSFQSPVGFYKVGATYRFDDHAIELRTPRMSEDGRDVWLWNGYPDPSAAIVSQMRKSKRLRVQVANTFIDFNLSGADVALSKIRCR